jgi:hypothetical protein
MNGGRLSILASSRTVFLALVWAVVPELGTAQTVVVRHSVTADVAPILVVRDSGWTTPATDTTRLVWSGEIRGNTAAELQVMVPRGLPGTASARADDGPWLPLEPGIWSTIAVAPAGRKRLSVAITTPGAGDASKPTVRVVAR